MTFLSNIRDAPFPMTYVPALGKCQEGYRGSWGLRRCGVGDSPRYPTSAKHNDALQWQLDK